MMWGRSSPNSAKSCALEAIRPTEDWAATLAIRKDHPVTNDALSPPERTILFALMAHATTIRNPDLKAIAPEMTPTRRAKFNKLGLVESSMVTRTYVHTLTDAGWAWCSAELSAPTPPKARTAERALAEVLRGIGRYLSATDTLLSDIFGIEAPPQQKSANQTSAGPAADLGARVRAAYGGMRSRPGTWVRVAELRASLADIDRNDFDATLVALQHEPGVRLEPNEKQSSLTAEDRAAAVRVGNQFCHLFAIED